MWDWGWGLGFALPILLMVLFWGSIIALIIWIVARFTRREPEGRGEKRKPMDFVQERYAKGEITQEEFEQLKKDLTQSQ